MSIAFDPNSLRNAATLSAIQSEPMVVDPLVLLELLNRYEDTATQHPATRPVVRCAGFDEWYAAYPRKKAKQAAVRAWAKAVKLASPDEILAGLVRYNLHLDANPEARQFIPHPATWLNGGQWEDDYSADVTLTRTDKGRLSLIQGAASIGPSFRESLGGQRAIGATS